MTDPAVSIVIPAYNAAATLGETVDSVLAGTFTDFELIIVDDGSTDDTAEVARAIAEADARVRLVQRSNGGLPAALNTGFAASRAPFVARLDADDIWHPEKLARQLAMADQKPEAAYVYTFFRYIDRAGAVLSDGPLQRFPAHALARGVYETLLGTGSSLLIRRGVLEAVGGCEESPRTWEDMLLQLKVSASYEIACVPEFLVGCRVLGSSLSRDQERMLAGWRELRTRIRQLFPQVPDRVHSWGHSARVLEFAEAFAWQGKYGRSAALLAEALGHDPAYVLRFLAYRLLRRAARMSAGAGKTGAGPHFFELDPRRPSGLRPHGPPREGASIRRLRSRREAALARLDLELRKLSAPRPEAAEGTSPAAPASP